jgi:acyl transferase domain-containing protein
MVTLQACEDEVLPLLGEREERVSLAAVNGPASTVVAGDPDAVLQIAAHFEALGRKTTHLRVSHAFHSPHMDGMLEAFRRVAEGLTYQPARIPIISNLSGTRALSQQLSSPEYWVRHVRHTVRFGDGMRALHAEGVRTFLEFGPHGVLTALGHEALSEEEPSLFLPTLRKGRDDVEALTAALAALHANGVALDWPAFFAPLAKRRVPLPTYAFQRERYWLETARTKEADPGAAALPHGSLFWQAVESGDLDGLSGALHLKDEADRTALALLLPRLSDWHQQRLEQTTLEAWRYRIDWKPLADDDAPIDLAGTWVVVLPATVVENDLALRLSEALTQHGAHVVEIRVGAEAAERACLTAFLRETLGGDIALRGVLSLVALDETAHPEHPAVPTGLVLTLALVQALGDIAVEAPLWLVTRGAVSVNRSDPLTHPQQAMTWGLGRVVGLEHPERWGGLLDLGEALDPSVLKRFLFALGNRRDEDQLALRPSGLYPAARPRSAGRDACCSLLRGPRHHPHYGRYWRAWRSCCTLARTPRRRAPGPDQPPGTGCPWRRRVAGRALSPWCSRYPGSLRCSRPARGRCFDRPS